MANIRCLNNITKEYPDMFKIVIFKDTKYFISSDHKKRNKELVDPSSYSPSISSLRRTKLLIQDIVLCNDFEYFCTFTFDPKKVDSFKFSRCWCTMSSWLHHQRDKSRELGVEFRYLIIPERHKSGRWHFHALLSGYKSTLKPTKYKTPSLRPIFNITSFRSGFSTAVAIDSKINVSRYITKYITKDFIKTFNQRRFFCSRNLVRPVKSINSDVFRNTLPLFRQKIADHYETEEFIIDKRFLV